MARDGLLPRQLAKTGSHGTPVRITVLVAALVAVDRLGVPDGQARRDGQRRHPVRVPAGVRRRHRPAPYPSGPAARVPRAAGAAAADRLGVRVRVADGQPDRHHLGPVRGLDGHRNRHLPAAMDAGTRCWPDGLPTSRRWGPTG